MTKADDVNKLVEDARTAGIGVDDRQFGTPHIRFTADPGGVDVDYYEVTSEGDTAHYGPNGQYLGSPSIKDIRDNLGL